MNAGHRAGWGHWAVAGLAGSVALLGVVVIGGWATGNLALIQIRPDLPTMKFNAAVLFLAAGLAILVMDRRPKLALGLGLAISLLAGLTLSQTVFGISLGIDDFVFKHGWLSRTSSDLRMLPQAALSFIFSAAAIAAYCAKARWRHAFVVASLLGALIFVAGAVGLFGYAIAIDHDYGWGRSTIMSLHTAVGFCLLGAAFMATSLNATQVLSTGRDGLLMIPVAAVLIAFNVSLSVALQNEEIRNARDRITGRLQSTLLESKDDLKSTVDGISRMASRWQVRGSTPRPEWEEDAANYIAAVPGMQTLKWVGPELGVRWIIPMAGNERTAGLPLAMNEAGRVTLMRARQSRLPALVSGGVIGDDGLHFEIVVPVFDGARFDGYFVATIDSKSFFAPASEAGFRGAGEWLQVVEGNAVLLDTKPVSGKDSEGAWVASKSVGLYGTRWVFIGGASHSEVASHFSSLPNIVLVTSLIASALLLGSLLLLRRSGRLVVAMEKQGKRFLQVFESSPSAMVMTDRSGLIAMASAQAERTFGYRREQMLGQPIEMLMPRTVQQLHPEQTDAYFRNPQARPMSMRGDLFGLRQDGTKFPVEVGLSPIETDDGLMALAAVVDISERVQQRELIDKRLRDLNRTGEIAKVGGWELDLRNNQFEWSDETLRMFNLPPEFQPSMEGMIEQYAAEARPLMEAAVATSIATGRGWDMELLLHSASGEQVWVRSLGEVESSGGIPVRLVGAIQDVSERKQVMDELARRNRELDNFAYVASHDLRSPLRGIDQLAVWISEDLEGKIDPESAEHLRLMRSRIERLERLLDDLLSYSRAGRIEGSPELIDSAAVVRDVFELCRGNSNFSLELVGEFPSFVTNRTLLELVFRNLISNAMKHHHRTDGAITASVRKIARRFEFSVADDGPGIPSEHFERIFGMFQTLRPRDAVEGSGMGLAIVKKTVEVLGGTIRVESGNLCGTVFVFSWPDKLVTAD